MKTLVYLFLIATLAGCAGTPIESTLKDGENVSLRQFVLEDLDVAIQIATIHKDVVAVGCFVELKKQVLAQVGQPAPVGAVSAYAATRAAVREYRAGVPEAVHVACAPLVVDAGKAAVRLLSPLR